MSSTYAENFEKVREDILKGDFVQHNYQGGFAGANSNSFDEYCKMRNNERERIKNLEIEGKKRDENESFERKMQELREIEAKKTAKRAEKRHKKKAKKEKKKEEERKEKLIENNQKKEYRENEPKKQKLY